jgi:3',5'-nucleoside bisphosphate phosphatase
MMKNRFMNMRINAKLCLVLFLLTGYNTATSQNVNRQFQNDFAMNQTRKILHIPDIPGYTTLKGDFHTHTTFSDGQVWPDFRVTEAWTEGLDIVAITDHLEYRPHKELPADHNAGFEQARSMAEKMNIILVSGAEITKSKIPPGHLNALFIEDANKLVHDDPLVQVEEAVKQGAFIMWNHPGWGWAKPLPDTTKWWDFQTTLLTKGWLHGIEIFNTDEWYPVALGWCLEKDLAVLANSDVHAPVNYWYDLSHRDSHRPMTLVFAKERSLKGVREALFNNMTLAWFDDILAGKAELITALFNSSVIIHPPFRESGKEGSKTFYAEIENRSDLAFVLKKTGKDAMKDRSDIIRLNPGSITILDYKQDQTEISCEITNCFSGVIEHPVIKLTLKK